MDLDLTNSVALWDCDSLIYRAGFSCEKKQYVVALNGEHLGTVSRMKDANELAASVGFEGVEIRHEVVVEPVENALHNAKTVATRVLETFRCPWEVYLSGKGNFRYEVAKSIPYKSNRLLLAKPEHYHALRAYVTNKYHAKLIDGMEADDEIAIRAEELRAEGKNPIVVSIDKDLKQIGGWYYNWVKESLDYIPELEAHRFFYQQMLTGDRTDAIPGLDGVGDTKAAKFLAKCRTPYEMYKVVEREYHNLWPRDQVKELLEEIGTLLWLQRTRDFRCWQPPSPQH